MGNKYHSGGEVSILFKRFAIWWIKNFNEALDKGGVDDLDEWTDLPFYGEDDTMAGVAIFTHRGFGALASRVKRELGVDLEADMGAAYLLSEGYIHVTGKEERIRNLVRATLKVYEDLKLAHAALSDLYTGRDTVVEIQAPMAMPQGHCVTLLDEAIGWVSYETLFQERHGAYEEDGSGVEWLRAFLEESDA